MGLFSWLFETKTEYKSEVTIERLKKWEQNHFTNRSYSSYNKAARYNIYRTDSGEQISLDQIRIPKLQQPQPKSKTFFEKIKAIAENFDKQYLPTFISDYYDKVHKEIHGFQDNLIKLNKLSENIKNDSLFAEIDHVFNTKLKILYNELLFCKFDKLGNTEYFNKMYKKLMSVYRDMKILNTDFTDYMYALTNTEYENTKHDLETIRMRVEAMSEVAEKYTE